MQLGVNHLGHWTVTAGLMPALLAARAARVVTVTSTAHHFGRAVDPDNPHLHGRYHPWRTYGQSKLANYHFGLGLQQQFERAGVRAQSLIAHPGLTHSDLQTRTVAEGGGGWMGPFWAWMAKYTGMDVEHGAMPQIRAATDPRAKGGQFYGPGSATSAPPCGCPWCGPELNGPSRHCGGSPHARPGSRSPSERADCPAGKRRKIMVPVEHCSLTPRRECFVCAAESNRSRT
jgi:hypothetical protein